MESNNGKAIGPEGAEGKVRKEDEGKVRRKDGEQHGFAG